MLRADPLADPQPLIRRIYAYVAYRLGDGPEAEDVTSEVFEQAVRYRSSYDPRRGEPIAWLIGIARRCIASSLSARHPVPTSEPDRADASGEFEGETVERLTLNEGLARLAEHDQELLALRFGADLSARRIGDLLDMRPNAVDVAIHRALARLREQLDARSGAGDDVARFDPVEKTV
jgi:RNA polymerase sigma-70 factor (ECF subfamily)